MRRRFFLPIILLLALFTLNSCTVMGLSMVVSSANLNPHFDYIAPVKVDEAYFGCEFAITDTNGVTSYGELVDFRELDQQQYEESFKRYIRSLTASSLSYPLPGDTVVVAYLPAIKKSDSLICRLSGFGFNSLRLDFIAYQDTDPDPYARLSRRLYRPPDNIYVEVEEISAIRLADGTLLSKTDLKGLLNRHGIPDSRVFLLKMEDERIVEFAGTNIGALACRPHPDHSLWIAVAGGVMMDCMIISLLNSSDIRLWPIFLL